MGPRSPLCASTSEGPEGRYLRSMEVACEFAVAALAYTTDLAHDASEVIFAIARCAGWIAHSLEEYPHRSSFRIRAVYTGPEPRGNNAPTPRST